MAVTYSAEESTSSAGIGAAAAAACGRKETESGVIGASCGVVSFQTPPVDRMTRLCSGTKSMMAFSVRELSVAEKPSSSAIGVVRPKLW